MTTLSPVRVGRVTASRVAGILGISPYNTADDVLDGMVRQWRGEPDNPPGEAMLYGVEKEPVALAEYERVRGLWTFHSGDEQVTVIHPEHDWIAVTPDGWVGGCGLVEIKCPWAADYVSIQQCPHYEAQVQLQLAVTGQEYCDFVIWRPRERLIVETVRPVAGWLEENLPTLRAFHRRFLEAVAGD